ncbi:MAG: BatA domain-containing protein [Sphingobacteriales bacterium]|nr:BatA domain-containing protein [Sphingobacteriales bacterium]
MQFIYPIGFLALASILLPILIHLWNAKQGKTLKIGSIAFLGESSNKSSRSFKITDWLLLTIRCLLLILIAFLLAQPFINQKIVAQNDKGWVLVNQNNLKRFYWQEQKTIDSLLEKGFEIHDFNVGFKTLNLSDTVQTESSNLSNQALLKQLNTVLPSGFKVYLFADNQVNQTEENRVKTGLNIFFNPILSQDSILEKVVDAFTSNQDSIKVLVLKTSPNLSKYELVSLTNEHKSIDLKIENGFSFVKTKSQDNWVKVNDETIQISIYNPKNEAYAYLNAALISIRDYTQKKIFWQKIQKNEVNQSEADLLFWLADEEVPQNLKLKKGAKLFSYQIGKEEDLNGVLLLNQLNSKAELFKRIADQNGNDLIIWNDSFGEPLLTLSKDEKLNQFKFYSRFEPQWTNLVWEADFAQTMLPLILSQPENIQNYGFEVDSLDKRVWDKNQSFFEQSTEKQAGINTLNQKAVSIWFWLAAFLLLFVERVLAYLKGKNRWKI